MTWLNIHCGTGILCICLPTYRPIVRTTAAFVTSSIKLAYGSGTGTKKSAASSQPYSGKSNLSYPSGRTQQSSTSERSRGFGKLDEAYDDDDIRLVDVPGGREGHAAYGVHAGETREANGNRSEKDIFVRHSIEIV